MMRALRGARGCAGELDGSGMAFSASGGARSFWGATEKLSHQPSAREAWMVRAVTVGSLLFPSSHAGPVVS